MNAVVAVRLQKKMSFVESLGMNILNDNFARYDNYLITF